MTLNLLLISTKSTPGTTQSIGPGGSKVTVIDCYHLLQKGEGGMAEVWLAEQKALVRRRAALKLAKAGMNTREVIARFESERQAPRLDGPPRDCQSVPA